MDQEKRIHSVLSNKRSKGIELLQKLVQQPSRRGSEGEAQAVIVEKCRQLGLEIDLWEIGDEDLRNHPNFYSDRTNFSGTPNLVAVKKGTGGGKSIILNGHVDVVPEGNLDDWEFDPYSGVIRDGRVYGRGTTDMKGGTVSLLLAIEAIIAAGISLKGDIIFQSVIEEESGGAGTLAAVLRGYSADGAVIPEPTDMKIFPLQQGSMWFRITVKGKSAHGGTRYQGVSAIDLAYEVISEIKQLEKLRNQAIQHPLYDGIPLPIPINVGRVISGDWPSSVPDTATIEGRFGIGPEESMEQAIAVLKECVERMNGRHEWFRQKPMELELFGARWLPGVLPLNHPLLEVLSKNYEAIIGKRPLIEASPWATDGGYLSNIGNTPVVVFGPGKTEMAHDANEYIEIDKMMQAAEVIAMTIIAWCGVG
ncbi:peptidase [Peribacillus sp. SCS-155]|uniref:peptidase n=1 Tax=Peribacillus sedimenti TaxID=3115297 RepID=UPI003905E436